MVVLAATGGGCPDVMLCVCVHSMYVCMYIVCMCVCTWGEWRLMPLVVVVV